MRDSTPTQENGPGVYNQTSVDIGYAWKDSNISAGPSVAFYVMPACGITLCGRIGGVAVGGHAQTNAYVAGLLGVSVSVNVDWMGGGSLVLPGHVSVVVVACPELSEEITEEVAQLMDYNLPPGIFCKSFAIQTDAAFKLKYKGLGASVTNP